jgi:hypothetical protein
MEFRGRNAIFLVIISTLFVPHFIFLMPNYLMMDRLGWLDTLLALSFPERRAPSACSSCASSSWGFPGARGERADRRGEYVDDPDQDHSPAVEIRAGHPGGHLISRELERLPLAGVRAVLAGTVDVASGLASLSGAIRPTIRR